MDRAAGPVGGRPLDPGPPAQLSRPLCPGPPCSLLPGLEGSAGPAGKDTAARRMVSRVLPPGSVSVSSHPERRLTSPRESVMGGDAGVQPGARGLERRRLRALPAPSRASTSSLRLSPILPGQWVRGFPCGRAFCRALWGSAPEAGQATSTKSGSPPSPLYHRSLHPQGSGSDCSEGGRDPRPQWTAWTVL